MIAYNLKIVTDGLVLCLDAANPKSYSGSGTTWYDTISGNNALLENGTVNWNNTGDYSNGSFLLTNSNFKTLNSFGGLSTFTVETIFKPTSYPNNSACVVSDYYPNYVNFKIGYQGSSSMNGGIYNNGWNYTTATVTPTLNQWIQVVITYNNAKLFSLYSNGTLINSPNTLTVNPISSNVGVRIGRRWDAADYFAGYVSTVKIYNRALSSSEIAQNFAATRGRFGL